MAYDFFGLCYTEIVTNIVVCLEMMRMSNKKSVESVARWMRRKIVEMTTEAGSGHPTSSLSAVELMAVLFFDKRGFFRFDVAHPEAEDNDRLIFSKGHASPLFYALWSAAGGIDVKELATLRKFGSRLEGHPTRALPFTEVPTGSLGQGLGVGMGEALWMRSVNRVTHSVGGEEKKEWWMFGVTRYTLHATRVWVLLGDSELAEGSVWEVARIAAHYRLGNLIAIVDANRLGQRGETMDGWDTEKIAERFRAFGWRAICVDGHSVRAIARAYKKAVVSTDVPTVIVAKTIKGKGVSFLENAEGWHGKALSQEECDRALREIGGNDTCDNFQLPILNFQKNPEVLKSSNSSLHYSPLTTHYSLNDSISPRSVYGKALAEAGRENEKIVALDAEVSNSTFAIDFAKVFPERFFEMYIAEQTMVSVATGMARRGYIPFVSTFAGFFSRAFDQLRMAQYAGVPLVCVGSHCGVSIGEDGASQMGLEDIAMFRTLLGSVVLYPSDAPSMRACVHLASEQKGVTYIRSTRAEVPVLYGEEEDFVVGGSKTLHASDQDVATIVAAGITVHEALKAYERLREEGVMVRVIDAYSIKPIDAGTIQKAARETDVILTVEDHFAQGGLGDAVREALAETPVPIVSLAVRKTPKSGTSKELLQYEEINAESIVRIIRNEKKYEERRYAEHYSI